MLEPNMRSTIKGHSWTISINTTTSGFR